MYAIRSYYAQHLFGITHRLYHLRKLQFVKAEIGIRTSDTAIQYEMFLNDFCPKAHCGNRGNNAKSMV